MSEQTATDLVGEVLAVLEQLGDDGVTVPELAVALSMAGVTAARAEILDVLWMVPAEDADRLAQHRNGHHVWTMCRDGGLDV